LFFLRENDPVLKIVSNFIISSNSLLAALKSPEHLLLCDVNLPKRLDQPRSWNAPFYVVLYAMLLLNF
jgi:hypothetical protein